jgi:hypothetical protein
MALAFYAAGVALTRDAYDVVLDCNVIDRKIV